MKPRGRKLSSARRELLDSLVADEWPIRQIVGTYGFNFYTVKKWYPDYVGMSQVEGGRISKAMKHVDEKMRQIYGLKVV